jgi:chaperone required for assembly of F1-ATPase
MLDLEVIWLQTVKFEPVKSASKSHEQRHVDECVQLRERQEKMFKTIKDWASRRFGVTITASDSLLAPEQAPEVSFAYADFLSSMQYPQLVGFSELAGACRSLLIAFALHGGQLSVAEVRTAVAPGMFCALQRILWGAVHPF